MEITAHCVWCGEAMATQRGRGRPRKYCRPSHRQRAYEARREAQRRGLGPDEVLLKRHSWLTLRDALAQLQEVGGRVAQDVAAGELPQADYVQAVGRLNAAVAELQSVAVEPNAAW
jgi:hypothetical protein